MKCYVVRDLLPGYLEGLTSEGTNEEVEKHLEGCTECRIVYGQMSAEIRTKTLPKKNEIDFLRKLKVKIRQRYIFGAFLICTFLIGTVSFLRAYNLPVSFDPERMTVKLVQSVYIPGSYGLSEWKNADILDPEETEAVFRGDYGARDMIRLVLEKGVGSYDFTSRGRTLKRDGEIVRVVYYCYTRSLWDSLLDPDNSRTISSSINAGRIYESNSFRESSKDYQPKKREIYYLPMGNMNRLDRLSDEEFDAQKENAILMWSGVI